VSDLSLLRAAHISDLARACDLAYQLMSILECEADVHERELATIRGLTVTLKLISARDDDRIRGELLEHAHRRTLDHARLRTATSTREITYILLDELSNARRFAFGLAEISASDDQSGEAASVCISPLAGRVTTVAARLLPCAERLRYVEEYRAELYDLARISRRAQWAYAVRLLMCALPLRRELRRDAREAVQGP
jgi:hypothetical protein